MNKILAFVYFSPSKTFENNCLDEGLYCCFALRVCYWFETEDVMFDVFIE